MLSPRQEKTIVALLESSTLRAAGVQAHIHECKRQKAPRQPDFAFPSKYASHVGTGKRQALRHAWAIHRKCIGVGTSPQPATKST
jgi:hypothetical protein